MRRPLPERAICSKMRTPDRQDPEPGDSPAVNRAQGFVSMSSAASISGRAEPINLQTKREQSARFA